MFERFTDRARRVLVLAQEEGRFLEHPFVGTEHILLGLISEREGVAGQVLEELEVTLEAARQQVEELIGRGTGRVGSPPFTPRAKKMFELSLREALQLGHNDIDTEHLLLGLIREGEGVGAQVVVNLGADLADVRQRVIQRLSEYQPPVEMRAGRFRPTSGTRSIEGGRRVGRVVACSFCDRRPPESGQLVMGRGALICEHCVRDWGLRLARGGGNEKTPGPKAKLYEPEQDNGGSEGPGIPTE